jgi:hypothetical protein
MIIDSPIISGSSVVLPQVSNLLNFTDDDAAAAGGVPLGGLYRSGNFLLIRVGGTSSENTTSTTTTTTTVAVTTTTSTTTTTTTVSGSYTIGEAALGGKIAYILQPGDPGYVPGETHGLIATAADITSSAEWGCETVRLTGAMGSALGTGAQNSVDILAECADLGTAARLCANTIQDGYSDWYLPSKDELNKLYLNRTAIGGFTSGGYWSSTQFEFEVNNHAVYQLFSNGAQNGISKDSLFNVRAVRSF